MKEVNDRRPRGERLWRQIAEAQDAALASRAPDIEPDANHGRAVSAGTVWTAGAPTAVRSSSGGRRRGGRRLLVGTAALLGAAAAAALVLLPGRPLRFQMAQTGEQGAPGRALVADAKSDLPLRFSDGSAVTFRGGSAGRVQRLTEQGAEVVLERGRLNVSVVHKEGTLWLVHAGPFRVRVTGTRFETTWNEGKLQVALYEGSVVIEGALLGAGVPLRAGHRLAIEGETVHTEALAAEPAAAPAREPAAAPVPEPAGQAVPEAASVPESTVPAAPAPAALVPVLREDPKVPARALVPSRALAPAAPSAPAPAPARAEVAGPPAAPEELDWRTLAGRGDHAGAFRSAERLGWGTLCRRSDARSLLALGDVARYAGASSEAREAFEALVGRFPRDRLVPDAVFSLGRLAFEAGDPAEAARLFGRYVDHWPRGPLAEQAAGRLLESTVQLDDPDAAAAAARAYLARAPHGPYAVRARETLAKFGWTVP